MEKRKEKKRKRKLYLLTEATEIKGSLLIYIQIPLCDVKTCTGSLDLSKVVT